VLGRGGLKIWIEVGNGTRVLNGVIGERLVKIRSIPTPFAPRQGVNKILDFSDPIKRKSLDFFDEFFLFHGGKYSTRLFVAKASIHRTEDPGGSSQ